MSNQAQNQSGRAELGLPVFLTAYDPSDLPGGSLDPLGFERGYLFLADKILPGLTNVANCPRYFSVLCAGAFLAKVDAADPPRIQYQKRLTHILRLERFWALANVLASNSRADGDLPVSGIRGVTYASDKAASLLDSNSHRTDGDFQLLSRQVPYGVVGIYGAVADGMRFIDRKTLTLTPDLGEELGSKFLEETDTPRALIKAVQNDTEITLSHLVPWGERSRIAGDMVKVEQRCLADALHRNPVRSRMAEVLAEYPFHGEEDTELRRMLRVFQYLATKSENRDLREAVGTILAYEECYRLTMLGFERLLWLCRTLPSASAEPASIESDRVLQRVCNELPAAAQRLSTALDWATTEEFRHDLHRLEDTRRFIERAGAGCGGPNSLIHELMDRHSDVQRGKFDKGRRKMPWLEVTAGRISLTMTRVGGLEREATEPSHIAPHPYRLSSADALINASRSI